MESRMSDQDRPVSALYKLYEVFIVENIKVAIYSTYQISKKIKEALSKIALFMQGSGLSF